MLVRLAWMLAVFVGCTAGCNSDPGTSAGDLGADVGADLAPPDISAPDILAPDLLPPLGIVTTSPKDKAQGVACDTAVSAIFSEVVDATSVTAKTFTVSGASGAVSGKLTVAQKVATFVPGVKLTPMVPYTVTVSTGVKTPDGRSLTQTRTWTFSCDRVWEKTVTVATGAYKSFSDMLSAIDGNGDAHLVWRYYGVPFPPTIFYSRYDSKSHTWSAAKVWRKGTAIYRIVSDRAGDVWLTWLEGATPTKTTVFAQRYDAKLRAWQPVRSLTLAMGLGQFVATAGFSDGVAMALHAGTQTYVTYSALFVRYSRKAGAWSKPVTVGTARGLKNLEIATDLAGTKVLLGWYRWDDKDVPASGLWATHSGISSSGWSSPMQLAKHIDMPRVRFSSQLLLMDDQGNGHVVIPNYSYTHQKWMGFKARRLDASTGKWGPEVQLSRPDQETPKWVTGIDHKNGHIFLGYQQIGATLANYATMAARYDPSTKTWITAKKVCPTGGVRPSGMVVDNGGNGVFAGGLVFRWNAKAGIWGSGIQVFGTAPVPVPERTYISGDGQGQALLVWTTGKWDTLYARWFR